MSVLKDVSLSMFNKNQLKDNVQTNTQYINPTLFDVPQFEVEGNIYALLDEGVLKGFKTGADLGIYDGYIVKNGTDFAGKYKDLTQFIERIGEQSSSSDNYYTYDNDFSNCVLAESDFLGEQSSKIVKTFKGYIEITNDKYSYIRKCVSDNSDISTVFVPNDVVKKYQLRHGDEILCTCISQDDVIVMDTLLTINQQSMYKYNKFRPWIKDLDKSSLTNLNGVDSYTKTIVTKFDMVEGDNVFMYLNNTSTKQHVISKLINELKQMFDRVVYINPKCKDDVFNGVIKFCAPPNAKPNYQATIALLGTHHARRLMEMGESVAVVIDDIDSILSIEEELKEYKDSICKTILNTYKLYKNPYTNFAIISLKGYDFSSYKMPNVLKGFENLAILVDGNEIDLFNSYRI